MENDSLDSILEKEGHKLRIKLAYVRLFIVIVFFVLGLVLYFKGLKTYSNNIFYYLFFVSFLYIFISYFILIGLKKSNNFFYYLTPFVDASYILIFFIVAKSIYVGYQITVFFIPTMILIIFLSGLSFYRYYVLILSFLQFILLYLLLKNDDLLFIESVIFIIIPFLAIVLLSYSISLRFSSLLKNLKKRIMLERFFEKELLNKIENDKKLSFLSGESKYVVIMFLDIRNFTNISEKSTPKQIFDMLNIYLGAFSEIIQNNNGMIDKYIGDCIMAVFGINKELDIEIDSINASKQILVKLKDLNFKLDNNINIGIGLHCGEVISGAIGNAKRMDYTVIGDVVNVASRIESLTKVIGVDLLVSQDFAQKVKMIELKNMGKHYLKGKSNQMELFTLSE